MDINLISNGEPLDYCVYMHKNRYTGEMYVGITKDLKTRWTKTAYKHCPGINESIQEWGWDAFDHEVLISGIPKSMALIIECELIKKYDLVENGLNKSYGSWDASRPIISKPIPVYQYDLYGTFVKKWNSITEAVAVYGISIYSNINGKCSSAYNYQWSKEYVDKMSVYAVDNDHSYLPIFQYDVDGNFIKKWEYRKDAVSKYGGQIIRCAQGKARTVGNYRWSFEEYETLPPLPQVVVNRKPKDPLDKFRKSQKVYRFDAYTGDLIKIYDNIAAIDDVDTDFRIIQQLCNKSKQHVHRKCVWVYEQDAYSDYVSDMVKRYHEIHRKIIQYDADGNYVKTFSSMDEIGQAGYNRGNVQMVCAGKREQANGFQWKYDGDTPPGKLGYIPRPMPNPIIQKSLNGEIITMYPNATKASKAIGVENKHKQILAVCRNKKESAFNYKWQFATNEEYENYIATKNNYENQEVM